MPLSNPELMQRITNHLIDDPAVKFSFSRRLARDNNWSHGFALKLIGEYKRFCYLAMVAGHLVTPSDEVDQVWHLHLLYTRDYWDVFCKKVLQSPLHHDPTKGGAEESERFRRYYSLTLESYEREFDQKPSEVYWPDVEKRFSTATGFQRINTDNCWIIPRPWFIPRKSDGKPHITGCGGCSGCGGCGGG